MTIRCRIHRQGDEVLVAACDEELLGETFREGRAKLEVHEAFYGGDAVGVDDLERLLRAATIANLTGRETVGAAVEMGLVDDGRVLHIDGVPHAQFVVMA